MIYFGDGDGDGDARVMEHQDCLGVGVESVPAVSRYTLLIVGYPKAFKNMTSLLKCLVYAQSQSSFLMTGAVISNTINVSLPIVMWVA